LEKTVVIRKKKIEKSLLKYGEEKGKGGKRGPYAGIASLLKKAKKQKSGSLGGG